MPAKVKSRLPQIIVAIDPKVTAALTVGAEGIAERAKQRVPVATGRLRDAIHVEQDGDDVAVVAGDSDVWYGHLVEHGTSSAPAQPFLLPAAEERRNEIKAAVVAVLKTL